MKKLRITEKLLSFVEDRHLSVYPKLSKGPLTFDTILRILVVLAFFGWNLIEGAVFENEYPAVMVALYQYPIWRVLFVILLIFATEWCPSVAIMIAFSIFFYIMDIEVTTAKWTMKDLTQHGTKPLTRK
jgi:hypothetical protein